MAFLDLLAAAGAGDGDKVKALLQQGKYCVDSFVYNLTPLHYASMRGHLNVVRVLVSEFNANLSTQNAVGCTPLMLAARKGHVDVVLALLHDYQCPVTGRDRDGWEVLHHACAGGSVTIVQTLLLEHKADVSTFTYNEETPLALAFKHQQLDVVFCLICKFDCDPNVVNSQGKTPLHYACERGDLNLVQALILHKADINSNSKLVGAPIHVALRAKKYEVLLFLMSVPSCDLYLKDQDGQTVLHLACTTGNIGLVNTLLYTHKMDVNACNKNEDTALQVAVASNQHQIALALVKEHGCDTNIANSHGQTPLHYACALGHVDLVQALIHDRKANINAYSKLLDTPLHVAFRARKYEVLLFLMSNPSCDPYIKDQDGQTIFHLACKSGNIDLVNTLLYSLKNACDGHKDTSLQVTVASTQNHIAVANVANSYGQTPLHYACERGDVDLVQVLLNEHKANVNAYSKLVGTPLHVAFKAEKYKVLLFLMSDSNCDPYMKDQDGQTVLHLACKRGNIDLVYALLCTHKMDVNVCNERKETPLHVAVASKQYQVALALVKEHSCDTTKLDENGWTVLHLACNQGAVELVHALIRDITNINVSSPNSGTPLHIAAWGDHYDVVLALVRDSRCDPSARGYFKRTALHVAASRGHHKIVQELLKYTSPMVVDKFGNTPLHLASENFKVNTVQCLLHDNAPVLVRNANGNTPRDVAQGECGKILEECIRVNRKQLKENYSTILRLAEKKYSGSHWITRMFVVGNPGAGKSSFIESLKREGFFESFSKVSESSVPPHTAGIIPSIHMSSQYGRVLFYDFAGDAEYYSSHAAIFETLASSRKGNNIFIVVVDLRDKSETIETALHYWFSFIQYQKLSRSSFIVVGGHLDQCVQQSKCLSEFCAVIQPSVHDIKLFMLDCRDPRSSQIAQVKKQILKWVGESHKYELSSEARLLLGLLEKDFSAVTACPVQTLVSHIKDSGGWLPVEPQPLHQILLELHEVGVLLLLGDCTKDTDHLILNICELTNEVHEKLFAASAFSNIQGKSLNFNIGVLPDSILKDVLPQCITEECLIHLQYCQEINHTDVGLFPSLKLNDSTSQSFLFFPALCSADKGQVPWDKSTGHSFSIRWLALCADLHDYFPPRFLHVLLLRLVHRFTLSVPAQQQTAHASPEHSRRCIMWKKGVYWKMEEGVDCMVELVKGNKGVVVVSKSSFGEEDCARVFNNVVNCVMEAKAEFCHSIRPGFFLLDSSAEADYMNEDHQFAVSDVKRAFESPKGKRVIVSVSGKGKMELDELRWISNLTLWNNLFPFELNQVLLTLKVIVREIFDLGLRLDAPYEFLDSLRIDFPSDTDQRRAQLMRWWVKNSSKPPCWHTLVEALEDVERRILADDIRAKHSLDIQLQEKLLCGKIQALKPDKEFLHSLSCVVGSKWPSLAVSLALREEEIEDLVGLSQQQLSFQVLKIWASRKEATYGQLLQSLTNILLFVHS